MGFGADGWSVKSIGSHPGAGVFRSTVVIIVILVCVVSFFSYTSALTDRAEEVAKDMVVVELKQAMAMMLYDFAIKGQLQELSKFHRENPFVPLAAYRWLPDNYHGTILNRSDINYAGWYFVTSERVVVYHYADRERPLHQLIMEFKFEDLDGNDLFDQGETGYLQISEA